MDIINFFQKCWSGGSTFVTYHKMANASAKMPDVAHWHNSVQSATYLSPSPDGANWWFCVNPLKERPPTNSKGKAAKPQWIGAQNDYISHSNAFYADFDKKDFGGDKEIIIKHIATLPMKPSAIVDSGNGYHCYWFLDEPCHDMPLYERCLKGWVKLIDSDPACSSISRKLRIPGTLNHKDTPLAVQFVEFSDLAYTIEDFEPYAIPEYVPTQFDFERDGDDIEAVVGMLQPWRADNYNDWFIVLCAIKAELGDAGKGLAQAFSQQSAKFDGDGFDKQWEAIKTEGGRNGGTLFYFAKEDSPDDYNAWWSSKAPLVTDDDSIRFSYPEQAKTVGFTMAQRLEFETTGLIKEFEPEQPATSFEIADITNPYEPENQPVNEPEFDKKMINDLSLCNFTLPDAQNFRAKGIDQESINAQDIAWVMTNTFEGACLISVMNGEQRAIPYFFNKEYGWTNSPNVFRSLARYAYTSVRLISDLRHGQSYRPPNLEGYLKGVKESLAGYLPNLQKTLEQSPKHIARDKKSYINMATGQRLPANRDYLTIRFLDEYPNLDWEKQGIANIVDLLSAIFMPKELKEGFIDGKPSETATEYWSALMRAIGQTFCNETNPRQFHWLYGKPDSGKGVFTRLNKMAFNELTEIITPAILSNKSSDKLLEIGKLMGALAAFIPDMKDISLNENINSLVGDSYAQGKQMYIGLVDVPIHFTIWMMSNYPPDLSEESVTSRAWVWYTDNEFPKDYDGSDEALQALIPEYIKFVQICIQAYLTHGLKDKPQFMIDHIKELRDDSSMLQSFINKYCEIDPKHAVQQKWLYEKFHNLYWSEDEKHFPKQSDFKKAILSCKGVYQKKTSIKNETLFNSGMEQLDKEGYTNGRFFMGIKFRCDVL